MHSNLYNHATVIDSLVAGMHSINHDRRVREFFEAMHSGGLTAVHVTHCPPYLRLADSVKSIAQWKKWLRDYSNIVVQVYTTEDIHRAKREGKVGIILGWQDSTGFDDHLYNIPLFKELGVGIVQLTYNTANSVGSGCFDSRDGGLTDFGREVIAEMNRVGIAVDLSHCGSKTSEEAILASAKPCVYTHVGAKALHDVPRNKKDAEFKFMAENGGHIGVSLHPPFQPRGNDATLDDFLDLIEYVINVAGEDQVGIGTDFILRENVDADFWETAIRDKFHARKLTEEVWATFRYPPDLKGHQDFPSIAINMERRGYSEARICKILGENFLRHLEEVWGV